MRRIALLAWTLADFATAQTWLMRTVAGGGPDNVPARDASLNTPIALCGPYLVSRDAGQVYRLESDSTLTLAATGLQSPGACALDKDQQLWLAEAHQLRRLTPAPPPAQASTLTTASSSDPTRPLTPLEPPKPLKPLKPRPDRKGGLSAQAPETTISLPQISALTIDANGTLYAATPNAIVRISNGVTTNVATTSAQAIALDPQGRLTWAERDQNRLRRLELNGQLTTVTTADAPRALAFDNNGILHIAEKNKVRRLDTNATVAATNAAALAFDATGALLTIEDTAHLVRRWTNATPTTIAGNGQASYSGDNGPATSATLNRPQGLWANDRELLIGDTANGAIRRVDLDTGVITTLGRANQPWGVAREINGGILIGQPDRVTRLTPDGLSTTVAGGGNQTNDNTVATQARLLEPVAVATDEDGNVFLAERGNNKLRRVTVDGGLSTVAGTGQSRAPDATAGSALAMPVVTPPAVAWDGNALFYADEKNNVVGRVQAGRLELIAGAKTPLDAPRGVAPDYAGGVFIAESGNGRIRHLGAEGLVTTVAEPGTLRSPAHLAFMPPCTLYAADTGRHAIRQFRPAVKVTIQPEPANLLLTIDGETKPGPQTYTWEGFSQHVLLAPSPQESDEGTRWIAPQAQMIDLACAPTEQSVKVAFSKQYKLTIETTEGGTVSRESEWFDAGDEVTLTASPQQGFVFTGWQGACEGTGECTVRLDSPKRVAAGFTRL